MTTATDRATPAPRPAPPEPADETVRIRRSAMLGGLELVETRFVRRTTAPHTHPDVEIGLIGSGERRVRCHRRLYHGGPGSIVIFRAGEAHAGAPAGPDSVAYRSFLIPLRRLEEDCGWTGREWFRSPVVDDPALAEALAEVHESGAGGETRLRDLLRRLSAQHRTAAPAPVAVPEGVQRARDYLDRRFAESVRLSDLANLAGCNVFQLIRAFREATGLPPYAYLTQVRVDRAVGLLRRGLPASRVAFVTGFSDQSHLTRVFKRLVGVPPASYQRLWCPARAA